MDIPCALELRNLLVQFLFAALALLDLVGQCAQSAIIRGGQQFAQLARQYSEDASAQSGGDLGWVTKGQLDPDVDQIVWNLKPGVPTGIVETKFGYHIIFVEDKQPAGIESFEHAKSGIREFLMTQNVPDVMTNVTRLTDSLMSQGKVAVHPENIR